MGKATHFNYCNGGGTSALICAGARAGRKRGNYEIRTGFRYDETRDPDETSVMGRILVLGWRCGDYHHVHQR